MNKQFKLGYALGLVVGEGSFTDEKGKAPCLSVKLHEVDPEPLLFLKAFLGGRLYGPYHYLQKDGVERRSVVWHLRGRSLQKALPLFLASLPPSRKRQQFLAWAVKNHLLGPKQGELAFPVKSRQKLPRTQDFLQNQLSLVS